MSAADGQLGLDGTEEIDGRTERVAKSLFWRDAKRSWGRDGRDEDGKSIATENAKRIWARVRDSYVDEARTALVAADKA